MQKKKRTKRRTWVTTGGSTVYTSWTIARNVITRFIGLPQETASLIQKRSNNDAVTVGWRSSLTTQVILKTAACSIIRCQRKSSRCIEICGGSRASGIGHCWGSRLGRQINEGNRTVLCLESCKIGRGGYSRSIRWDGDHTELALRAVVYEK